jgi:hypothetical protein
MAAVGRLVPCGAWPGCCLHEEKFSVLLLLGQTTAVLAGEKFFDPLKYNKTAF